MRSLKTISLVLLLVGVFLLASKPALAQHACACTATCSRSCSQPSCGGTCDGACALGSVAPLTYSGSGLMVLLNWAEATNANAYEVIVRNSTGTIIYQEIVPTNLASFTGAVGQNYNWTVRAFNNCYPGSTVSGPAIGFPNATAASVTLAVGEASECTNTVCNTRDLMVGLDSANHNQIIPVRVTIYDLNAGVALPGQYTNLKRVTLIFDNDTVTDDTPYRIVYTDNADNTYSLEVETAAGGVAAPSSEITVASGHSRSRDPAYQTLTLNFSLDFTGFPASSSLLSNLYLYAEDFSGISSGRVLKVGTGAFSSSDSPYSGHPLNSLDIWNGRDVAVNDVGFYVTNEIASFCAQSDLGEAAPSVPVLDASYAPNSHVNWLAQLDDWTTNTYYQPYYYYQNDSNTSTFAPAASDYYLYALSTERYGSLVGYPTCRSTINPDGSIDNIFLNGGVRVGDSSMGDSNLQTAFALLPVADSWSEVVNGSAFVNNSLTLNIEPLTCSGCFFSTRTGTANNGVLVVNGDLNLESEAEDQIGNPQNWSAQTVSGNRPFTRFEISTYSEIKALYEPESYTEYLGDRTITDTGINGALLLANNSYFIDGNLTIDSATALRAIVGNYLLLVVNGDITITENVIDPSGVAAIQAILIALDNGSGTGNIIIEDDALGTNEEDNLTIEGALIAGGTIAVNRSLVHNNNTEPALKIVFRPDMLGKMQALNLGIIDIQKTLVSQN